MGIGNYFLENFILLFELVGLLLLSFISAHLNRSTKNMTRIAILVILLESIATYVELWTQSFETLSLARPMLTALKYSLYPIVLILCMQIISPIAKKHRLIFSLLVLPSILSIPFYFTSQWTYIIFYFLNNNSYIGGPLKYWPYFVTFFYVIVFMVQNAIYLKNLNYRNKIIIFFISIASVVGVIVYLIFKENVDYTIILATALLLYYTFTYIYRAGTDTLTGLYNRQSFYQDMKINVPKKEAIVSIDMNDLKFYNDNFGHSKGDEALMAVGHILENECGEHGRAYRIGGDEFVILYTNVVEKDVVYKISHMKDCISKTEYSCAFGYAMKNNNSAHDTLLMADASMYEDKKKMKKEKIGD